MNNWYEITNKGNQSEIFIYDEIGYWGITAKEFIDDLKQVKNSQVTLRINSPGGSITDGNAIYNAIKALKADVTVQIDSLAASMATIIALAGNTVSMAENGFFMIHNPQGGAYGEAKDLETIADLMVKMKSNLVNVYTNKTGKDAKEISDMMDNTTWMTAQEAFDEGFIDEITDEVDIDNSFNMKNLEKVPAQLAQNHSGSLVASAKTPKEDNTMTDKVKKVEQPQDKTPVIDKAAIEAKFKADEMKRKADIKSVFAPFQGKHSDLMNSCLDDMDCTEQDTRDLLLAELGKGQTPSAGIPAAIVVEDKMDKFSEGVENAILAKHGIVDRDAKNNFNGADLLTLGKEFLTLNGQRDIGNDKLKIAQMLFAPSNHTTSDFSSILANTANKSMLKGYEESEETFQQWTSQGSLSDFKIVDRVGLNTFPALDQVREGGEYNNVTIGDRKEQVQLATYGNLFAITRQAIINDDTGSFTQVPMKMGRAAIRTVGDLVYAILTNNPVMSDGIELFHADHNNLVASGSGPSTPTIDAARTAMGTQKDPDGNTNLNIRPQYLIVPRALEGTGLVVRTSQYEVGASTKNNTIPNMVANTFDVISDSRLDTASSVEWYMSAGQSHDTVEVSYLDGNSSPVLEQQPGWNVDGVEFKVRIDAVAKAMDFRGLYKNSGA